MRGGQRKNKSRCPYQSEVPAILISESITDLLEGDLLLPTFFVAIALVFVSIDQLVDAIDK